MFALEDFFDLFRRNVMAGDVLDIVFVPVKPAHLLGIHVSYIQVNTRACRGKAYKIEGGHGRLAAASPATLGID
jgi:hypothetical protein